MKYFFILGNNPTLSAAEIAAVFPGGKIKLLSGALVMEEDGEINAKKIIKKLGGSTKIGLIESEVRTTNEKNLLDATTKTLETENVEGKFKFGFSNYSGQKINLKKLGMEIKNFLKEKNISCRWVTSREPTLSSVVVEQNKLNDKGREFVFLGEGEKILIGRTLAVQPFKELSFRDYGRPARDDYSGMLPPKLAQIMINLTGTKTDKTILDPFCGSGTILTEAMLMGYKNLIGSDISEKATEDTKKNIEWIKNKFQISDFRFQIFKKNSTELSRFIKPKSVDVIATEPYLGPQRGKPDINRVKKELEELYSKTLAEAKKILVSGGKIVMIWPEFRVTYGAQRITPNLGGFKIINPIPESLIKNKIIKITNRNTIVYGRPGQKVWREIVVLEEK